MLITAQEIKAFFMVFLLAGKGKNGRTTRRDFTEYVRPSIECGGSTFPAVTRPSRNVAVLLRDTAPSCGATRPQSSKKTPNPRAKWHQTGDNGGGTNPIPANLADSSRCYLLHLVRMLNSNG
jgi:hypothetical protein